MKVYVIKNEQGQYQTPDISFISSIWQSDLFNDYEVAKCYCQRDCEIIECELMEKTELADYTNQVRKEVVQDIKQEVKKLIESKDFGLCNHEYANGYCYGLQYDLAKILDQLQGEKN